MSKIENQAIFEDMPIPKAARRLMLPTVMSSLVMVIYSLADAAFGFYCSLFGGIVISLLCFFFRSPVLELLGADVSTVDATAEYMKWTIICGAVPSIVNVVMAYFVRSEGAALHASIGTMSGCILNMILDPIFIMPWGLGMGAAGAGLATFLSNCAACGYFMILLFVKRGRTFISLHPKDFTLEKEIVKGVCAVGIPASLCFAITFLVIDFLGVRVFQGIVYGAFAAEVILACVSTVILTRLVKKLQEGG